MDIRQLTANDATGYRAVRLRALREHPEAFTSSYEEEHGKPEDWYAQRLTGPRTQFWGAFADDGQLCGVVGLDREARAKNRHKATVVGMFVSTEHNGQGIGRKLMEALCAQARTDGLELLVLTVTQGNDPAQKLYENTGFRSFGVEPRAIKIAGHFFAKNHMVLELATS